MTERDLIDLSEAKRQRELTATGAVIQPLDPITLQGKPIPPRRWLVPGLIPWRSATQVGGDGGVGKSLLMLQAQVAAAVGMDWIGRSIEPMKSYGIYAEDDGDEIHRRLADICRHYSVELGDLENMRVAPRVGQDNLLTTNGYNGSVRATDLYEVLLSECRSFGAQLVIIDTVADVFGGNENYRSEVRAFIGLMRRLALELDGCVMLTAHPSQAGLNTGSGISGSTAWNNSVRSRLYLTRPKVPEGDEPPEDERILKTMKSNYGARGGDIPLTWRDGVFVGEEADTATVAGIKKRNVEKLFLELLADLTRSERHVSDSKHAGNYAPKVMVGMPKAQTTKPRLTRHHFERAMEVLFAESRIKIEEYGRSGKERRHIVAVATNGGPE